MAGLQTEFEFILPKGFIDNTGTMHRRGTMRMATAMDEIAPLRDPRVKNNQAYLSILLLARVITKLGTLEEHEMNSSIIERLFSADLAYLQSLYNRVNSSSLAGNICPTCNRKIETDEEEVAQSVGVGG